MASESTVENASVLLVGWKAKAIRALSDLGAQVTSVVTPHEAPKCRKLGLGRTLVASDTEHAEDVVATLARSGLAASDFHVVAGPQELTLLTAALVAAPAGNSALPLEASLALRDKAVQKAAVRAAGVPVATCEVLTRTVQLQQCAASGPVVVKPLSGAGSADTFRVADVEEGHALAYKLTQQGLHGPWLVEEFIDGVEMPVDGVVRDGKLRFFSVSRYLNNVIHMHDGGLIGAASLAPSAYGELYEQVGALVRRALPALGLANGVFHMEVFATDGKLVFSECGGRVGGGLTDEMLRHRFNVDIYDEWARAVLGMPSALEATDADPGDSVGYVHLTTPAGRVVRLPDHQELRQRPGVVHAELDVAVGDVVEDLTTSSHLRAARAVLRGIDDTQVAKELRALAQWFRESVEVDPVC